MPGPPPIVTMGLKPGPSLWRVGFGEGFVEVKQDRSLAGRRRRTGRRKGRQDVMICFHVSLAGI